MEESGGCSLFNEPHSSDRLEKTLSMVFDIENLSVDTAIAVAQAGADPLPPPEKCAGVLRALAPHLPPSPVNLNRAHTALSSYFASLTISRPLPSIALSSHAAYNPTPLAVLTLRITHLYVITSIPQPTPTIPGVVVQSFSKSSTTLHSLSMKISSKIAFDASRSARVMICDATGDMWAAYVLAVYAERFVLELERGTGEAGIDVLKSGGSDVDVTSLREKEGVLDGTVNEYIENEVVTEPCMKRTVSKINVDADAMRYRDGSQHQDDDVSTDGDETQDGEEGRKSFEDQRKQHESPKRSKISPDMVPTTFILSAIARKQAQVKNFTLSDAKFDSPPSSPPPGRTFSGDDILLNAFMSPLPSTIALARSSSSRSTTPSPTPLLTPPRFQSDEWPSNLAVDTAMLTSYGKQGLPTGLTPLMQGLGGPKGDEQTVGGGEPSELRL